MRTQPRVKTQPIVIDMNGPQEVRWFADFWTAYAYCDFVKARGMTSAWVDTIVIGKSYRVRALFEDTRCIYDPAFRIAEGDWLRRAYGERAAKLTVDHAGNQRDDLDAMLGR